MCLEPLGINQRFFIFNVIQLEPPGFCYFNPPRPPTPPPLFLFHLVSVDACLGLDSRFSSHPAPLGFLYVFFLSLSLSRAPPLRLLLLARYP